MDFNELKELWKDSGISKKVLLYMIPLYLIPLAAKVTFFVFVIKLVYTLFKHDIFSWFYLGMAIVTVIVGFIAMSGWAYLIYKITKDEK